MHLRKRGIGFGVVYVLLVSLSGLIIYRWLDLNIYDSMPGTIWAIAWIIEYSWHFKFAQALSTRDWIAHLIGMGFPIAGLLLWPSLIQNYPVLLQRIYRLGYLLSISALQMGAIYLLSSSRHREMLKRLL